MQLFVRDKTFYKTVATIAIPITLQSLITIGINMADTVMVGSLGEVPLSAAALANQFIHMYQICCMGIGMGASVLTSRYWGMNDLTSLRKTVTIMLRIALVLGALFTIVTILMPSALMRIYTPDPDVIADGAVYFIWSVPTYLLLGLSLTCTIVLRSVGQVRLPLYTSIASFFVNVFFNWGADLRKTGCAAPGNPGCRSGDPDRTCL